MNTNISGFPENQPPDFLNDEIFPLIQMIPGIVHNISNPLTIIKVRSQILQNKMPESPIFPAMIDNVAKIEDILGNLADRVNNLHNPEIRPISLKNLVMTEMKYLEADLNFKHRITKKIELQESQPYIKAVYQHLSFGLLAAVSALTRMMDARDVRTLSIGVTCQAEQITMSFTATAPGLSDEDIRFFGQLNQFTCPSGALETRPAASPELQLLVRSYFCFKPYISDYSVSHSQTEFKCLITFPTGN